MFHNIKEPAFDYMTENACMYANATKVQSDDYFAKHFDSLGYSVGVFGKHLNRWNVRDPPQGVNRWFVNGGGSYLNPSFTSASVGEVPVDVTYDNCTTKDGGKIDCYSTSVIGNVSTSWIQGQVQDENPFFAYIAVKAPHIQDGGRFPMATPAPWYQNATIEEVDQLAPRTPNYNASCPDHHWLVRQQPPLTDLESSKVDELYLSRLRTLLSVDDLVEDVISTLEQNGVLDNTYILFTSDNGYQLGQFRIPQGKWNTYEHDIRVPMYLRGPGIHPGSIHKALLGTHVDIMPTLLGLASHNIDSGDEMIANSLGSMDGENHAPLLLDSIDSDSGINNNHPRRNAILIEYIGLGHVVRYGRLEDSFNNTFRTLRVIDPTLPTGWQNIKYAEFTDCREDWTFAGEPHEVELFDLNVDPYEMKNIIADAPRELVEELREIMRAYYTCAGDSCRGITFPASRLQPSPLAIATEE